MYPLLVSASSYTQGHKGLEESLLPAIGLGDSPEGHSLKFSEAKLS